MPKLVFEVSLGDYPRYEVFPFDLGQLVPLLFVLGEVKECTLLLLMENLERCNLVLPLVALGLDFVADKIGSLAVSGFLNRLNNR